MKFVRCEKQQLVDVWPRFLLNDAVSHTYWDRLVTDFPDYQFALVENDERLAEANCAPVAGQPRHWRDALRVAFESHVRPDRVCALAIVVAPEHQGRGLSRVMLEHTRSLAAPIGDLVAPVRPTLKTDHPHVPIEEYAGWRRDDGTHFDPWIRTHERVGGTIAGVAEEAMLIEGPVASWHEWTGLDFAADGEYVVPGALVPVTVRHGHGVYREPCVWLHHVTR